MPQERLLDWGQFALLLGGSRPPSKKTIRRWMKEIPGFPQPVVLGPATLRFRESEGRAFIKRLRHGAGVWKTGKAPPKSPGRPRKIRPESTPTNESA